MRCLLTADGRLLCCFTLFLARCLCYELFLFRWTITGRQLSCYSSNIETSAYCIIAIVYESATIRATEVESISSSGSVRTTFCCCVFSWETWIPPSWACSWWVPDCLYREFYYNGSFRDTSASPDFKGVHSCELGSILESPAMRNDSSFGRFLELSCDSCWLSKSAIFLEGSYTSRALTTRSLRDSCAVEAYILFDSFGGCGPEKVITLPGFICSFED